MEPVHIKEVLLLLDKGHLSSIQNEGDGSLQHAIEGIITMVEALLYVQKKQTSISIFLLLSVFYHMFMLYWSSRAKSILNLNIAYFLTLFVRKNSSLFLSYLDRAMKKVKSLKLRILTKSLKCRHIEIADNVDQARSCPLFIGLFVVFIKGEQNQSTQHLCRRSHQRCSVRKGIQRNFKKFTGNTCARVSFLIKLQGCCSGTGVFLRIL